VKTKLLPLAACVTALVVAALSTGGEMFLILAALLILMAVTAFWSVRRALNTLTVTNDLSEGTVTRGDRVLLTVTIGYRSFIPVAPITLYMNDAAEEMGHKMRLEEMTGRTQQLRFPFDAEHVGVMTPGVNAYGIQDLFGIVSVTKRPRKAPRELLVLPCLFDVEDLKFAPGESGTETISRATEDVNLPAEARAYQAGDPLKKIHWKLSAKKGSLVVRRFEEPTYPDALVLLDCSAPPYAKWPEAQACVKDTLLETAASVVKRHINGDHPIRLPLSGERLFEFDTSMGLQTLMEELARVRFTQTERFERVLLLETRRMRKQGATVIITARLNSNIVDMIIRIRRMGPYVRVYLVTFEPDKAPSSLVSKLQQHTIEVCYVTPALWEGEMQNGQAS